MTKEARKTDENRDMSGDAIQLEENGKGTRKMEKKGIKTREARKSAEKGLEKDSDADVSFESNPRSRIRYKSYPNDELQQLEKSPGEGNEKSKNTRDDSSLEASNSVSDSRKSSSCSSPGKKRPQLSSTQCSQKVMSATIVQKVDSNVEKKVDVEDNNVCDKLQGIRNKQMAQTFEPQEVSDGSFSTIHYIAGPVIAFLLVCIVASIYSIYPLPSSTAPNHSNKNCIESAMKNFNISKEAHYLRKAKSTLTDKRRNELVVLTFIGFPPEDDQSYDKSFKTFKENLVGCLVQSIAPTLNDAIHAGPGMKSLILQGHINSQMGKFPKFIWVENFEVLPGSSLQLLRKYTDEFDPSAEDNLVILSFSVPSSYNKKLNEDHEKVAKDYLRDLFSSKLENVEIDPYLARVANNLFPFVMVPTE